MANISSIILPNTNISRNLTDTSKVSTLTNQGLTDAQKKAAQQNIGTLGVSNLTHYGTIRPFYGKIFYIDSTATGCDYVFFDSDYNEIEPVIGGTPAYFIRNGTISAYKYYAFDESGTLGHSSCWTFYKDSTYYDADFGTVSDFGRGRYNTVQAYNAWYNLTESGYYIPRTWWQVWNLWDWDNGYYDHFIGTKGEMEALRTATDAQGNKLTTVFETTDCHLWSSSEVDNYRTTHAWLWDSYGSGSWVAGNKHYSYQSIIMFGA